MANAGLDHVGPLRNFTTWGQRSVLAALCEGEERAFYVNRLATLRHRIQTMPRTYGQDGKGDEAVAYLHYFTGAADWYITERDLSDRQYQAFGLADLGFGPELGYISIAELLRVGAELDLHFEPRTLRELVHPRSNAER